MPGDRGVPARSSQRGLAGRDFLSERARRGRWERTSGSTGSPMSSYWANDAHREMLRTKYRLYAMWGLDILRPHGIPLGVRRARTRRDSPGRWPGSAQRWKAGYAIGFACRPFTRAMTISHYLRRIAAFRPGRDLRLQQCSLPVCTRGGLDPASLGHQPNQALRAVDVQVVHHEHPVGLRIQRHRLLDSWIIPYENDTGVKSCPAK